MRVGRRSRDTLLMRPLMLFLRASQVRRWYSSLSLSVTASWSMRSLCGGRYCPAPRAFSSSSICACRSFLASFALPLSSPTFSLFSPRAPLGDLRGESPSAPRCSRRSVIFALRSPSPLAGALPLDRLRESFRRSLERERSRLNGPVQSAVARLGRPRKRLRSVAGGLWFRVFCDDGDGEGAAHLPRDRLREADELLDDDRDDDLCEAAASG